MQGARFDVQGSRPRRSLAQDLDLMAAIQPTDGFGHRQRNFAVAAALAALSTVKVRVHGDEEEGIAKVPAGRADTAYGNVLIAYYFG